MPLLLQARTHWTELNIGPFFIDSDGDIAATRNDLNTLEQLRWVLGGLLESKDLPSLWPFRVILTKNEGTNPSLQAQFVSQNPADLHQFVLQNGQYLLVSSPNEPLPLGEIAGILLDANAPRLPPEVEGGMRELFSTLQAHGPHVTWGTAPVHPDLAWARMQLFATKFEYSLNFHIFLTGLRNGSTVQVAEQNAFGKPAATLEAEAAANLAAGHWNATPVSGRPLDPKRDFGEHSADDTTIQVYIAEAHLATDPQGADAAFKAAVNSASPATPLGYAGLAELARRQHQPYKPYLDDAIQTGSRSAPVYLEAAEGLSGAPAIELLKKAATLNPLWAEPLYRQAQLVSKPADREALLHQCTQLDPRKTECWVQLAQLQAVDGHGEASQGSWFRAELSAPTDTERDRIHQLRLASEEERLNAEEAERRRQQEAAEADDQRALRAEAARIHAAERRANRELAAQSGAPVDTSNAVPWSELTAKKLQGSITEVACSGNSATLSIRTATGGTTKLLLPDRSQSGLSCGVQRRPLHVSVSYSEHPDDQSGTAGEIVSLTRR